MTLIEIVVSISIFSIIGMVSIAYILSAYDSYSGVEESSTRRFQYEIALNQIVRQLQQALPASVQFTETPSRLRFGTIQKGGVALSLDDNILTDQDAEWSQIQTGTVLAFSDPEQGIVTHPVEAVDRAQFRIRCPGIRKFYTRRYWIAKQWIEYRLQDGSLIQRTRSFHSTTQNPAQSLLCNHVTAFRVEQPAQNMLFLSLEGESKTGKTMRESRAVSLYWGN